MMAATLPLRTLTVDQTQINLYAELTGDANPLHLDAAFAATTAMGGIIGHGTMTSNLLWQVFAATGLTVTEMAVRFLAPVRPGDRLAAGGELEATGRYRVWVRNQDGVEVVAGHALAATAV